MQNLFNVAAYRRNEKSNWIEVDVQNITTSSEQKELEIEVKIRKRCFWDFIVFNDKANWELNSSDSSGEHVQQSGQMSEEEYFELDNETVYQDIYEFIAGNPIRYRSQIVEDSLKSILNSFNQ